MSALRFSPAYRRIAAGVAAALVGVSVIGCATTTATHAVRITAAANPSATFGYAYTLAPQAAGRAPTDSLHAEVTQRIHTALSQRGMYEAIKPEDADVIVTFDYGEHAPHTEVTTVTEPVLVANDPFSSGLGMGGPAFPAGRPPGSIGSAMPPGHPGVVMVESLRVTRTSEKYLRIDARENSEAKDRVWSVDAIIEDEGTPIAECIPAMVDAVIEYMGASTREPETVVIKLGPGGPTR